MKRKAKKIHLDLNHYRNDKDGLDAFFEDFFLLSIPLLIKAVYEAEGFHQYYRHMEHHTRQIMELYEKLKSFSQVWKDFVREETALSEGVYPRFFVEELFEGIRNVNTKSIIK